MKTIATLQRFLATKLEVMQAYCLPLVTLLPAVASFEYARYYDDGYCFVLSNRIDQIEDVLQDHFLPDFDEMSQFIQTGRQTFFMSSLIPPSDQLLYRYSERYADNLAVYGSHDLYHRFYFASRHSNYFRVAGVGIGNEDPGILECYTNHQLGLEQFILLFELRAKALIQAAYQERLFLPHYKPVQTDLDKLLTNDDATYAVNTACHDVVLLSRLEMHSLLLHVLHYPVAQVADVLAVSTKKIKQSIKQAMQKLGESHLASLHQLLKQQGLLLLQ